MLLDVLNESVKFGNSKVYGILGISMDYSQILYNVDMKKFRYVVLLS